ncbi:hypothetical protein [Lysinibacillus sp. RC79]|uniref:hypothetical protein n=1 Tax=Lysinibacillus sp. RC79 TaxID=3156296 RepID=UPI003515678D
MAKQMKKYIAVTTASFMAMQLAACGNTETQTVKESTVTTDNTTEENNTTTAGNGVQSVYDSDMANSCDKWKESDDGSFECLDENSPHYAHHFFNGLMYATAGAMLGSAIYKSHNLRNGTDREDKDKGGGSAVPRTNPSNTSESKNTNSNGITTNGSQNPSGTTSSSSNNSTTNSSNSNTSGSKSYSSGKRSYSNSSGSSTNSSNSYSNHSSSSTGKSGFGSGGASRGGSSSS